MRRYFLFSLLAAGVLSMAFADSGRAQTHAGTAAQHRACRHDALAYCRGIRDDNAIASCLRANISVLRPACRRVFGG
jgi:hypothetical protein